MQQIATLEENLKEATKNAHEKEAALQSQLSSVTAAKQTTEEELVSLLITKRAGVVQSVQCLTMDWMTRV
jgi:hypothetical protein